MAWCGLPSGAIRPGSAGHCSAQAPAAAPHADELRAALERGARRRDAAIVGGALLLGGLVWLALAHDPAWLGWTLLTAGAVAILYGLWRAN